VNAPERPQSIEKPVGIDQLERGWGSDYLAEVIRALDLEYVALNPGASFRGLHDSLVNYLGNDDPRMLLCLHEEHAVAIAHGWAKVTGKPMGAFVHSNVGLMHATMAIFNAWCDRVPVVVLGATGAVDAARRRPWIEWIHTVKDQGALVRDYTKWDDQPASLAAAGESLARAKQIATTAPHGPVYVVFGTELQEDKPAAVPAVPDIRRFASPAPAVPAAEQIDAIAQALVNARAPVILAGRVSRSEQAWRQRIELAEALNARALTDFKLGAAFPTDHPLHAAPPALLFGEAQSAVLRAADVVLSFDWLDLAGTLRTAFKESVTAKVIQISVDQHVHRGWSMDYQGLPPVDINVLAEPDVVLPRLLAAVKALKPAQPPRAAAQSSRRPAIADDAPIGVRELGVVIDHALAGIDTCLMRLPLGWVGDTRRFTHPLDYLGYDGGGGIGSGLGMATGSALALRGTDRLPVAVLGDGDFMMGASGLWTAVHYRIPMLVVVANNQSFYNDEVHQERVAVMRSRPVENKWIGQRIADPDIDFARLAEAQGARGIGPVRTTGDLARALAEGIAAVRAGEVVVIDARVDPGYDPATAKSLQK
jgi:thiamine pyrophosphate-dependent acetolactate synthase large subunit-like protein